MYKMCLCVFVSFCLFFACFLVFFVSFSSIFHHFCYFSIHFCHFSFHFSLFPTPFLTFFPLVWHYGDFRSSAAIGVLEISLDSLDTFAGRFMWLALDPPQSRSLLRSLSRASSRASSRDSIDSRSESAYDNDTRSVAGDGASVYTAVTGVSGAESGVTVGGAGGGEGGTPGGEVKSKRIRRRKVGSIEVELEYSRIRYVGKEKYKESRKVYGSMLKVY